MFHLKDLNPLIFCLDLEIARSSHVITLNYRQYTLDLLEDNGILAAKPASTPCDPTFKFTNTGSHNFPDVTAYKGLIRRIIYMFTTRPNIAYYVQQLSQYLFKHLQSHFQVVIHMLRHLKYAPFRVCSFTLPIPYN